MSTKYSRTEYAASIFKVYIISCITSVNYLYILDSFGHSQNTDQATLLATITIATFLCCFYFFRCKFSAFFSRIALPFFLASTALVSFGILPSEDNSEETFLFTMFIYVLSLPLFPLGLAGFFDKYIPVIHEPFQSMYLFFAYFAYLLITTIAIYKRSKVYLIVLFCLFAINIPGCSYIEFPFIGYIGN